MCCSNKSVCSSTSKNRIGWPLAQFCVLLFFRECVYVNHSANFKTVQNVEINYPGRFLHFLLSSSFVLAKESFQLYCVFFLLTTLSPLWSHQVKSLPSLIFFSLSCNLDSVYFFYFFSLVILPKNCQFWTPSII